MKLCGDDKTKSLYHFFFCFFFENQVQGQPDPCASPMTATSTSTLPTAAPTQMAVAPQAQPSVVTPSTQQQISNDQVLYVSQPQYQSGMVATTTGVPGHVDVNTAEPHAVPTVQPVVSKIII